MVAPAAMRTSSFGGSRSSKPKLNNLFSNMDGDGKAGFGRTSSMPSGSCGNRNSSRRSSETDISAPRARSPRSPQFFSAGSYEYEVAVVVRDDVATFREGGSDKAGTCAASIRGSKCLEDDLDTGTCNSVLSSTSDRHLRLSEPKTIIQSTIIAHRPVPHTPVRKTVYLIRHAESHENRRQKSLANSLSQVRKLTLPTKEDLTASLELVDVPAQLDSDVSDVGARQIRQVGDKMKDDNFVESAGIELVVHSPLRRARQTSAGMLGCAAPKVSNTASARFAPSVANNKNADANSTAQRDSTGSAPNGLFASLRSPSESFDSIVSSPSSSSLNLPSGANSNPDPTAPGLQHPSVSRTVELQCLTERTPLEALPINFDKFTSRIASFERWLASQPETVIAVVGHSLYFKCMLGLDYKFSNCDVWRVTFDASVGSWSDAEVVKREVREELMKQRESIRREKQERVRRDMEEKKEKIKREVGARAEQMKREWERLASSLGSRNDGGSGSDDDEDDFGLETLSSSQTAPKRPSSSCHVRFKEPARESIQISSGTAQAPNGPILQTEDWLVLDAAHDEEDLPRGWSGLMNLYSYEPEANIEACDSEDGENDDDAELEDPQEGKDEVEETLEEQAIVEVDVSNSYLQRT